MPERNWFGRILYRIFEILFGTPAPSPVPPPPEPVPDIDPIPPSAPPAPDSVGPRIVSIKHGGKWDVWIKTAGCEDWKIKEGKKDTQGILYIKGIHVDAMRPDQMHGAKKELENAFGSGEHSLNVTTGDPVVVQIKSYDGRQTAAHVWQWPFAST